MVDQFSLIISITNVNLGIIKVYRSVYKNTNMLKVLYEKSVVFLATSFALLRTSVDDLVLLSVLM